MAATLHDRNKSYLSYIGVMRIEDKGLGCFYYLKGEPKWIGVLSHGVFGTSRWGERLIFRLYCHFQVVQLDSFDDVDFLPREDNI